jgi:hypothetical protein
MRPSRPGCLEQTFARGGEISGSVRKLGADRWLPAAKHLRLRQVLLGQPLCMDHTSCMLGLGGIPSAWRSRTVECLGGNISFSCVGLCGSFPGIEDLAYAF